MRSLKEEKIREKVKEKFESTIYAVNEAYMDYFIEEICLDGWFTIEQLKKMVHLMELAKAELDKKIKFI